MLLLDVNILVYAHRQDASRHREYLMWLEELVNSDQTYGLSDLVLSRCLRVATHPEVFSPPSTMDKALAFAQQLREQPNCTMINPGPVIGTSFVVYARQPTSRAISSRMPPSPP